MNSVEVYSHRRLIVLLISVAIALTISKLPLPEGLTPEGLRFIGIFVSTLVLLVFGKLPNWTCLIYCLALTVGTSCTTMDITFSGFAQSTWWLIIGAYIVASSAQMNGVLTRLAMNIIKRFPQNYTGQILAIFVSCLVIGPMIISISAKGVTTAPFTMAICDAMGYEKGSKPARGLFAAGLLIGSSCGHLYYSGAIMVGFMLNVGFGGQFEKLDYSWFGWFQVSIVWGAIVIIGLFISIVLLCQPDKEKAKQISDINIAQLKLNEMGKMKGSEKLVMTILVLMLLFWMTEPIHHIPTQSIGLIAAITCSLFAVFKREHLANIPWDQLLFIGAIMSVANIFPATGVSDWLTGIMMAVFGGLKISPVLFLGFLAVLVAALFCVIPSTLAIFAIFQAAVCPIAAVMGIHPLLVLFIVISQCGHYLVPYAYPSYLGACAVTNNRMGDHKDHLQLTALFILFSTIGIMASVPLWRAIGLIIV